MSLEDLYRMLRSDHVQAQGMVDTIRLPLLVLDQGMSVLTGNNAFFQTFQIDRDDTIGESLFGLGNGQWDIPELRQLLTNVVPKSQRISGYGVTHTVGQLGPRTILVSARRMVHPENNSTKLLLIFDDVTDRRREDREKDILIAESQHRMKNFFSVVHALARQTATEGISANEYREAFLGRLCALAAAQEISASGDDETSIGNLVRRTLQPFEEQARIQSVDEIPLSSDQVTPVCMILHELTVNAAKYGALSVPEGVVSIDWKLAGNGESRMLSLFWREENGPPVTPATHAGFGTRLIDLTAHGELGGQAELHYEPKGVQAVINIPMR
jgi:two-component sensor histidine kinase